MTAVAELKEAYKKYKEDADFLAEFEDDLKHYVGRTTPRLLHVYPGCSCNLIRVQFFFTLLKINSFTSYVMDL
jgi:tryptophan synthase beta subunit